MQAIQINQVTKRYGSVTALDQVSFCLPHGKIYGLLGRNGAGKSTLINIIANRIFADAGEVRIDGLPARENIQVQEKIFCMSEADLYDTSLKIKEQFRWISRFYDSFDPEQAFAIARQFQLDVNKRFKGLSKGYQSIFKLTVALALHVPYVIFDEPVLGLDANHRELFYQLLLQDYQDSERTIVLATHLIEEVSHLIEEVVFLDRGKVLLQENVENLLQQGYCVSGLAQEVDAYCQGLTVIGSETLGNLKLAYLLGPKQAVSGSLQISALNLQKLFVKLTQKGETEE